MIKYEIGDVLEVLPSQNPAAVDSFIQRCNLDPESLITVSSFAYWYMVVILLSDLYVSFIDIIDFA